MNWSTWDFTNRSKWNEMKMNNENENEKKGKRKKNIDLAVLPSHNTTPLSRFLILRIFLQFIIGISNVFHLIVVSLVYFLRPDSFCSLSFFSSVIISIVLWPFICSSFQCLQFLSSLAWYCSLYFLSDHQNNFLAVNLLGNQANAVIQWKFQEVSRIFY